MRRTPRLLLAVLSLLALALSACGGSESISDKSASGILKETFGPGKRVDSGKLDLRISFDSKGLTGITGPLKLALNGPFASTGKQKLPKFDFNLNADVSGQAIAAGAVSTGDKAWLKFANQAFSIDDATFKRFRTLYERDQSTAAKKKNPGLTAIGVDPTRWLSAPKKAGNEDVGGAETVHVTSQVEVRKFLEDVNKLLGRADATGAAAAAGAANVPSKLTDAQRTQIERSVKSTSLDVYAGKDDGTLRRLNIQVTFAVPADVRASVGGLQSGRLGLDLVLTDLNEKQAITAPTSARPLSDLTGATGATGAAGGTTADGGAAADSGSGAAAGSGSGAAGSAGSASTDAYRQCVDAAGSDISKVQKCAPLLNAGSG